MTVTWTRTAKGHLRSIHDYIATDSPRQAQRFVDRLTRRVGRLTKYPRLGPMVDEYQDESIRELLHGMYRIIYRVVPSRIDILAVVHGAMLLPPDLSPEDAP
jgi:Plasmid stabilization system protein